MSLLLVTVYLVISTSLASDCPPGEYKNNDLCCPMCHIGTVVKIHCNPTSSSNVCIPCVEGTYMDHPNGLTKCLKCTECDVGAGLLEKKKCTYTSNTECECQPGYFCPGSASVCDICLQHTVCVPGEYVKVQGTSRTDNVCEKCPVGTFSTENMSQTCTAWTECSEKGLVQTKQGTTTSDSICVDRRKRFGLYVPFILLLALMLCVCCKMKLAQPKDSDNRPVQETNAQLMLN